MADNVRVAVRVRPFNQRERDHDAKCIIKMDPHTQSTVIINPEDGTEKRFSFDFSYNSFVPGDHDEYASQETVWRDIGRDVLDRAFEGYNCSLFAYGQTGSGKSYSMVGYGQERGIIPLACERIFARIDASKGDPDVSMRVEASMLEIYMERVKDLFAPAAGELKVRNDPKKGFYVEGLTRNAVADATSIAKLMDTGSRARTVASTAMNATSSRAHTIFQILLTQTRIDRAAGTAVDKVALINLIDLAGSERANSTGATGDRLKEGSAINLSLSCLGNVISALAANGDPKKKPTRVPYRDSVLTMLLANSLGGNAKTVMIAALSPADINYEETLSTLRYADRAKQIKNSAVVNEDPNERMIRSLKDEVEALRRQLAEAAHGGSAQGGGGGALSEEERARMRAEIEARVKAELGGGDGWEARLAETRRRAEEAARELAEMGVVTGPERDAQIQRAAHGEPHFANLHEDPQLSGQVLHFLPAFHGDAAEQEVFRIGRRDAEPAPSLKLAGASIQRDHATVSWSPDGTALMLAPATFGAKLFLDGEPIHSPTALTHQCRVVFGASQAFVFVAPLLGAGGAATGENAPTADSLPAAASHIPPGIDYASAMGELNKGQAKAMAAEEAARRAELEQERAASAARIAEMEERMVRERAAAEADAAVKIKAFEERAASLAGNEELIAAMKAEQRAAAEAAAARTAELEAALAAQVASSDAHRRRKERELRERSVLDEQLLRTIPLVNEANAMSEEMGKGLLFEPKLMAAAAGRRASLVAAVAPTAGDPVAAEQQQRLTDMFVRVTGGPASVEGWLWHVEKFTNRLYLMREVYAAWVDRGRPVGALRTTTDRAATSSPEASAAAAAATAAGDDDRDPFNDPPEDTLIGRCTVYLDALQYALDIAESTPIIDYRGHEHGELQVKVGIQRVVPIAAVAAATTTTTTTVHSNSHSPPAAGDDGVLLEDIDAENLSELKGSRVRITVDVDSARGLPATLAYAPSVRFQFFLDDAPRSSADDAPDARSSTSAAQMNPQFKWRSSFTLVVSDELLRYVGTEALDFEVWGRRSGAAAGNVGSVAGGAEPAAAHQPEAAASGAAARAVTSTTTAGSCSSTDTAAAKAAQGGSLSGQEAVAPLSSTTAGPPTLAAVAPSAETWAVAVQKPYEAAPAPPNEAPNPAAVPSAALTPTLEKGPDGTEAAGRGPIHSEAQASTPAIVGAAAVAASVSAPALGQAPESSSVPAVDASGGPAETAPVIAAGSAPSLVEVKAAARCGACSVQ